MCHFYDEAAPLAWEPMPAENISSGYLSLPICDYCWATTGRWQWAPLKLVEAGEIYVPAMYHRHQPSSTLPAAFYYIDSHATCTQSRYRRVTFDTTIIFIIQRLMAAMLFIILSREAAAKLWFYRQGETSCCEADGVLFQDELHVDNR